MIKRPLHMAKKEISHEILDARDDNDSARYVIKIGKKGTYQVKPATFFKKQKTVPLTCIDKVCYPPNICPRCKSKATFHRRMQQHGNIMNVWRVEVKQDPTALVSIKYDFCLDCHSEFVIEMFIFKK